MLLVLDNYEHLLSGPESDRRDGYGLVTKLVAVAPEVKLLITSRTRLNVRAEWLAPLEGLALPPDDEVSLRGAGSAPKPSQAESESLRGAGSAPKQSPTSEEIPSHRPADTMRDGARNDFILDLSEADLLASPTPAPPDLEAHAATALFLSCARRIRPGLRPTTEDAQRIVDVCRLLDGMPLAIELAAAWVRALPLAEIARRLEAGLDLLATTQRDASPRHRSMRAAFDHSWRLLSAHERSILRQLSVFRGGCTAEAAEAVAGATVLDLAGLGDKSWLRADPLWPL